MTNTLTVIEGNILTIKVDLSEEVGLQAEPWQQAAELSRKQWEESQWYLEEARVWGRQLEEQLRLLSEAHGRLEERHREATERVQEAARRRDEANWYLGESRTTQEGLRQEAQQLDAQLLQAQGHLEEMRRVVEAVQRRLDVERARRQSLETQLAAVRTHGERRVSLRTHRPDVTVEVQRPDGTVLFHGLPRDVSPTGLGFVSDRPIDEPPDLVQIRLHVSGAEPAIDATGLWAWQEQEPRTSCYLAGCELFDMPADGRRAFEQLLN